MAGISIMIPTFNRGGFIRDCIDSVLAQGVEDIEIVVVDDGSTDSTKEIVDSYALSYIKYYYQEHKGIPSSRNQCLKLSTGDLLAFIDSDDMWVSGKLRKQIDFLDANPNAEIVFTKYKNYFETDAIQNSDKAKKELDMERTNNYALPTALFRRRLSESIGEFNEDLAVGEDVEWIMRMRLKGVCVDNCIEEQLYLRRLHENNSVFVENTDTRAISKALAMQMRKKIKQAMQK